MGTLFLEAYEVPKLFFGLGHLLNWLVSGAGIQIGWAVVLFTLIVKTILLPLDYWSKASMKKNNLKLEKLRPQLEKLQKQYANDQMLYNQKMQALYKKEGYSIWGACIPTLITLVLFFLVFKAFNDYLRRNLIMVYNQMYDVFINECGGDAAKWAIKAPEFQSEFMPSFLWVKNIWMPDVPWDKAIMEWKDFTRNTKITDSFYYEILAEPFKELYVRKVVDGAVKYKVNGYLVLPILAAGSSWLLQFITNKTNKAATDLQGGGQTAAMSNKMMAIIMPLMIGIFSLTYTAIFSIYLVTSSLYSILTTVLVNKIVDKQFQKKEQEIKEQSLRR